MPDKDGTVVTATQGAVAVLKEDNEVVRTVSCKDRDEAQQIVEAWRSGSYGLLQG